MLQLILSGFAEALMWPNPGYLVSGVLLGTVMGAIPGFTSIMAIALIIPLTFYMDATAALIMIIGAYNGGIYGGSISAILLSTPGTPASAATVLDGYQLAMQGKAGKALKMAVIASIMGSVFSTIVLTLVAAPIAKFSLKFGPAEFALIMLFSLTIVASVAGDSMIKGLIGAVLGMLFSTVGMDPIVGLSRFTFGWYILQGGIHLTVMLIGLLAVSQIFHQLAIHSEGSASYLPPPKHPDDDRVTMEDFKKSVKTIFRSSAIGCAIGALPALGPTLASYIGYDRAKRASKTPELFGKGAIEGVAAAEAANNAVCGANLIPLLAFGVPGDLMAAIMMGALLIQGLTPGPFVFQEAPLVIYGVYSGLLLSNVVLFFFVWYSFGMFAKIARAPSSYLFPAVVIFCIVGVYALQQSWYDVWIMLFFSVIGYVMMKFDFSTATMLIGFVLGPLFEDNFRQALIVSRGSLKIFFSSTICLVMWVIIAISIFTTIRSVLQKKDEEIPVGL